MSDRIDPMPMVRRAALPAGCIAIMAYFAFHAVSGPTGVLAWRDYKVQRAAVTAEAAKVAATKAALQHQVDLLDPQHVDPDLADELVRKNLGVVRPDEVIVPLPDTK
jgi:cell division protein FtsB